MHALLKKFSVVCSNKRGWCNAAKGYSHKQNNTRFLFLILPCTAFALGTWQVYRLKWKEGIIRYREERKQTLPTELKPSLNLEIPLEEMVNELEFRPVSVKGEFLHSKEMIVGPKFYENHNGFYVITPFKIIDG